MKTKSSTSKSYKNSAKKATWDDSESEFEKDSDTTYVCFLTRGDRTHKAQSEPTLDDAKLTFDDLTLAFEELQEQ